MSELPTYKLDVDELNIKDQSTNSSTEDEAEPSATDPDEEEDGTLYLTIDRNWGSWLINDNTLVLYLEDEGGYYIDVADEEGYLDSVEWTSSDENVATMQDGCVEGVSAGTAIITATDEDGCSASFTVIVENYIHGGIESMVVTKLPSKTFTSPVEKEWFYVINDVEYIDYSLGGDDVYDVMMERSIGCNMEGAEVEVTFKDGTVVNLVYEYNEDSGIYYFVSDDGYILKTCVWDNGNYEAGIMCYDTAVTFSVNPDNNDVVDNTSWTELPTNETDNQPTTAQTTTTATGDTAKKTTNTDSSAVQTGSETPALVLFAVLASGLVAAIVYRRKIK